MGTTFTIKLVNPKVDIKKLSSSIDSILYRINNHLSTYISNSEITNFNQHLSKKPFLGSDIFTTLIQESIYIHSISNGSFDITVQPLVDLWGFSFSNNDFQIPSSAKIDSVLSYTGTQFIKIDNKLISKLNSSTQLDLSAIAKGKTVDIINKYLNSLNLDNFYIDIGGEIYVSGFNKNNEKWEIGIRSPNENSINLFSKIFVSNKAIATSGTYLNYFVINDHKYSHIINPKSGMPIKHDLVSVTIIADKCYLADAIATATMVKGAIEGLAWINSLDGVEGLLIYKDDKGGLLANESNGFKNYTLIY
tara:strand:+ start:158 stop:1075 length:918 start_codon:yes stop_codon:yes gene_type:complete